MGSGAGDPPALRLPDDVWPLRYALTLDVDPRTARYSGTVDVLAELEQARDVIWIHGRELHVGSSVVAPEGGVSR